MASTLFIYGKVLSFQECLNKLKFYINKKIELKYDVIVYIHMKQLILIALLTIPFSAIAENDDMPSVTPGDVWTLGKTSGNTMTIGGEVLYLMPNSAYETYRSRKFNDWNQFSMIDTRNLVKLKKGYQIEIIEGLYQDNIFKVKLLSGNNNGRKYYVITEDLIKKYKLEDKSNEK